MFPCAKLTSVLHLNRFRWRRQAKTSTSLVLLVAQSHEISHFSFSSSNVYRFSPSVPQINTLKRFTILNSTFEAVSCWLGTHLASIVDSNNNHLSHNSGFIKSVIIPINIMSSSNGPSFGLPWRIVFIYYWILVALSLIKLSAWAFADSESTFAWNVPYAHATTIFDFNLKGFGFCNQAPSLYSFQSFACSDGNSKRLMRWISKIVVWLAGTYASASYSTFLFYFWSYFRVSIFNLESCFKDPIKRSI